MPSHSLGEYHDASEVLQYVLDSMGIGTDLFDAKSTVQCSAVLPRGVPDAESGHLCDGVDTPFADIQVALKDAFADDDDRLTASPNTLEFVLAGRTYCEWSCAPEVVQHSFPNIIL